MLKNLLIAVSHSIPEVGYIQGLNIFVACFVAKELPEFETYWIIKYFLNKMKLKGIIISGFPKLYLMNYQLKILIKNFLPAIYQHLENEEVDLNYFTLKWFVTLLSSILPIKILYKVWNLFLFKGWKIIFKVALSLFDIFQNDLLSLKADDLSSILINMDEIISNKIDILEYKISNRLLKEIEILYQFDAPETVQIKLSEKTKKKVCFIENSCQIFDLYEYMNFYTCSLSTINVDKKKNIKKKIKIKKQEDFENNENSDKGNFFENIANDIVSNFKKIFSKKKEENQSEPRKLQKCVSQIENVKIEKSLSFCSNNEIFTKPRAFSITNRPLNSTLSFNSENSKSSSKGDSSENSKNNSQENLKKNSIGSFDNNLNSKISILTENNKQENVNNHLICEKNTKDVVMNYKSQIGRKENLINYDFMTMKPISKSSLTK